MHDRTYIIRLKAGKDSFRYPTPIDITIARLGATHEYLDHALGVEKAPDPSLLVTHRSDHRIRHARGFEPRHVAGLQRETSRLIRDHLQHFRLRDVAIDQPDDEEIGRAHV